MTTMEQIIEAIKSNREELISKYNKMVREIEFLKDGMEQMRLSRNEKMYDSLWVKSADLHSNIVEARMAINELGNALNHLGESTETFWG